MNPSRGLCFVRPVHTPETLAGGSIVLLESTRELWTGQQAEVVAVGLGNYCEDLDCTRQHGLGYQGNLHPCLVKPGDWVLVMPRSFTALGDPRDRLWCISQDAVLAVIES